ncbi:MAG: ABC transporter ATP-binding protein [Cellvibrionales bacterium TMED148]|nr:multidrug ABC transporter ATP-binding protein [Porticoccaceae bacterium]RPG90743.1 MAG: ABC transporter ATP-binding protein [Cellvibrionales bacterium TMED148]
MLEATSLSRNYGVLKAVDKVSFSVKPGEIVGLLGHNGAGKSTIMKMITGFLEPSGGRVLIDGEDVLERPEKVRAKIGYLPESPPLYTELSVMDYLCFSARMRGCMDESLVLDAIRATNLQSKALEQIRTLSRGFKQRVSVAQAILSRPKFLILDEPSNGLDPEQNQEMRALIQKLAEEATVILSTHVMQEVSAICDRVLIMRSGQLAVDKKLTELSDSKIIKLNTCENLSIGETLKNLDTVLDYKEMAPGSWDLNINGNLNIAAAEVVEAMVASRFPVHAIGPKKLELETLFHHTNESEGSQ